MTHVDLPNESKGGVAYQVHYLANALVSRGHQVTMFTFSPAWADCHYHVHQYPPVSRLKSFYPFLLAGHLARTNFSAFDILHTNGDNFLLWGRHPQIRTFYGSAADEARSAVRLRRRLYQWIIVRLEQVGSLVADVNVGISEATRKRVAKVSTIIPCGVDLTRFCPGAKSKVPTVLFVGTSGGRKRGTFLADIFRREVRSRFPSAELWTVAEKPIEGEGIINYGKVSLEVLTDLFRRAWVFCLPSTYEGFGVPYIEAMASGTAVVATPNPGACEVLSRGEFGILVEDSSLGSALNHLLDSSQEREIYATKGLLRAQNFSWDRVAKQYEDIYAQLVQQCPMP